MKKADQNALFTIAPVVLVGAGLAWAGSQGGAKAFGFPLFAVSVALAFMIQWIAFIPAYLMKTEVFYDLTGSVTYISVTALALVSAPSMDARSLLLSALVLIWAGRLGSFLFNRVRKAGKDVRFDEIKVSFFQFLRAWTLQGLWVAFTLAAALAAITTTVRQGLGWFAGIGVLVWAIGFAIEVVADRQKSQFRAIPENRGRFISTGLWSWSRHPNYFGEIVLWVGVAIIASPVLRGWQWVTLISPVFVTLLLTRISGVSMLEKRADKKWGGQEDYEMYKQRTSVLIPRPPSAEMYNSS